MPELKKSERLKKELGLIQVYALATGTTLSAGFFLLPGLAAIDAGPAVPLAYLLATLPLFPAVFSILELATAMPRAGGVYYFLDRSMGPLVGTIGGLGTWLALSLKSAFALIGMGAYIHLVWDEIPVTPVAIAFAVIFGLVNLKGAKGAGSLQLVLVGGLLIILTGFLSHIRDVEPNHFQGFFDSGFQSIFATAGLVYISYVGVTKVASVSEEVKNPGRNLPLGVFLAMGTSIVIYVLGTTVMIGVVPMADLMGDLTPVATAAHNVAGPAGLVLIVAAALLAFSSVANAGILSCSRYPLAMSRDRMVPSFFAKLNGSGIPVNGVIVTVALILFFLLAFEPIKIAKLASAFQLLLFSLICAAVIVMRESRIESYDPAYRSPLYPWMQIVGIFVPLWMIGIMGWLPILFTVGMLAAATLWYFHYGHVNVERDGAVYHVFERLGRQRFEGLDAELRGILKEKGLRKEDPFDEIVARAHIIDAGSGDNFEAIASRAATLLAERVPAGADHILEGFLRGTRVGLTPVSHGAALPHLRLPGLPNTEMVLVRATAGMRIDIVDEFGEDTLDTNDIHAIFFLISPEDNPGQHLRILAQIAERVDDDAFMSQWQKAEHEQQLKETLLRTDRYLPLRAKPDSNAAAIIGQSIQELDIPVGCLVALVRRGGFTFVPRAETIVEEDDRLTIIGEADGIGELSERYG